MAGYTYDPYRRSETVTQAEQAAAEHAAAQPGAYSSRYGDAVSELQSRIESRQPFSYDINGDALYQQYRSRYAAQGRQAMEDTMGQAAGLTGGYGSTYSQSAGQQQYDAYLQKLTDIMPQLTRDAYDRYTQEGAELYDRLAMYQSADRSDYDRWADAWSRWQAEQGRLDSAAQSARDRDYQQWSDSRSSSAAYYSRL